MIARLERDQKTALDNLDRSRRDHLAITRHAIAVATIGIVSPPGRRIMRQSA
jgi:hypothetical protein